MGGTSWGGLPFIALDVNLPLLPPYSASHFKPDAQNWFTYVLYKYAKTLNPGFGIYSNSDVTGSIKSAEAAYAKLFVIYLQLHVDQLFPASLGAEARPAVTGSYRGSEMRVLMRSMSPSQ